jgi:hypothetical protein
MNSSQRYSLFGHPVTRRAYLWSWLICPGLALIIYLSTRERGTEPIRFAEGN